MNPDYSMLGVAIVLGVAGIAETIASRRKRGVDSLWMDAALKTDGVVTRIDERETYSHMSDSFQHSTARVAVVVFRARDGIEYQIEASGDDRQVGSKVPLAYNPDRPSDARPLEKNAYRGGCGLILIAIGLALAAKALL